MKNEDNDSNQESFYSINNTKTQFTFVQEPPQQLKVQPEPQQPLKQINVQNILQKFDIRQSSAIQLQSSDLLNQSFRSVASKQSKTMNLHDISAIDQQQNELECSVCLQNQIDCLSVPQQVTPESLAALHQKINLLKMDQSNLRKQISIFQEAILLSNIKNQDMAAQVMQVNKFIKKKCEHDTENAQPFNIPNPSISSSQKQVVIRTGQQSPTLKEQRRQKKKHFDIKPNRGQSVNQKQANAKYKECSFNREVILLEDKDNQYRIQIKYENESLIVTLINFQKGDTNFIHAIRINQPQLIDKISEKIVYPLTTHAPKRFTLSLSIMLLIFEQNKEKQQSNLVKIQEIRTVSIPLPINYFIQPRFSSLPKDDDLFQRLMKRLYIYEIDINYNADYASFKKLQQFQWISHKWISLRGSNRLIWMDLGEINQRENGFGVIFKIGCKDKDCQEAIDIIQYLCFMLSL